LAHSTQAQTPLDFAIALTLAHPELCSPDVGLAAVVKQHITNQGTLLHTLATTISQQGKASLTGGWATLVQVNQDTKNPAYAYVPSVQTLTAAQAVLQASLAEVKTDPALQNLLWTQPMHTEEMQAMVPPVAPYAWTATGWTPQFGITVQAVSADANQQVIQIVFCNEYPVMTALYVEFLDARGTPIVPANWTPQLPTGAAQLETSTLKYAGLIPPTQSITGIAQTASQVTIDLTLPAQTASVRLTYGTLGLVGWNAVVNPIALVASALLGYAVPWVYESAGTTLSLAWYNQLLANQAVLNEVIMVASNLTTAATTAEAIAYMRDSIGSLLFGGGLPNLYQALKSGVGQQALQASAQGITWGMATLLSTAVQPVTPGIVESLSTPATCTTTVGLNLITSSLVQVVPDSTHGSWPLLASRCEVTWTSGQITLTTSQTVDFLTSAAPLTFSFENLPNNLPFSLDVTLYDARSHEVGHGSGHGTVEHLLSVTIQEAVPEMGSRTLYQAAYELCYDAEHGFRWQTAGQHSGTVSSLDCSNVGKAMCDVTGISFNGAAHTLAYSWRAAGQNLPTSVGGTPSDQQLYVLQAVSVTSTPETARKSSPIGFYQEVMIACGGQGRGDNLFLDDRSTPSRLRSVTLGDATPFAYPTGQSRGSLTLHYADDVAIHPDGYVASVDTGESVLQICQMAPAPVPDEDAPMPYSVGGKGTRVGLLANPVAVALSPDGLFLVLENGNRRVQAFDVYGNPCAYFPSQSPCLSLKPVANAVTYLDLDVDQEGYLYVLYYQATTFSQGVTPGDYALDVYDLSGKWVSTTTGVNAARISVDAWRNLYTLDYDVLYGPHAAPQPSIRIWRPITS